MKAGANAADQVQIKKLAKAGKSAKVISEALRIEAGVVKNFMPVSEKKDTKK